MRVVVDVSPKKLPAFMEHLKGFKDAKVVEEASIPKSVAPNLKAALLEVEADSRGEKKLRDISELLNAL